MAEAEGTMTQARIAEQNNARLNLDIFQHSPYYVFATLNLDSTPIRHRN
jgi:hypothetical protein